MERILFINACVRPISRTMELAKCVLSHLDGEVEEVNLEAEAIRPHTRESLQTRETLLSKGEYHAPMFRYARQFREAETIVIAAPYYDLSFPSSLKNYLESICNVGVTFYYDENEQPQSLCKGKRLIYVSTSGAEFLPDFGFCYVKRLFSEFFHIEDAQCFYAEKLDLRDINARDILAEAKQNIAEKLS